jgi:hypothetical protein
VTQTAFKTDLKETGREHTNWMFLWLWTQNSGRILRTQQSTFAFHINVVNFMGGFSRTPFHFVKNGEKNL